MPLTQAPIMFLIQPCLSAHDVSLHNHPLIFRSIALRLFLFGHSSHDKKGMYDHSRL